MIYINSVFNIAKPYLKLYYFLTGTDLRTTLTTGMLFWFLWENLGIGPQENLMSWKLWALSVGMRLLLESSRWVRKLEISMEFWNMILDMKHLFNAKLDWIKKAILSLATKVNIFTTWNSLWSLTVFMILSQKIFSTLGLLIEVWSSKLTLFYFDHSILSWNWTTK